MPLVRGAADCVFGYDDTIAVIDCAKSSRKNTDVGFGTSENKRITLPSHQFIVQKMTGEGRINRLIDQSGGSQIWKRRYDLQQSRVDRFPRRLPPFFVVAAPHSRHILRPLRRDKPRKNCSFWKSLYDRSGAGKHGFHPRCRPNPIRSEQALHVDAKVQAFRGSRNSSFVFIITIDRQCCLPQDLLVGVTPIRSGLHSLQLETSRLARFRSAIKAT